MGDVLPPVLDVSEGRHALAPRTTTVSGPRSRATSRTWSTVSACARLPCQFWAAQWKTTGPWQWYGERKATPPDVTATAKIRAATISDGETPTEVTLQAVDFVKPCHQCVKHGRPADHHSWAFCWAFYTAAGCNGFRPMSCTNPFWIYFGVQDAEGKVPLYGSGLGQASDRNEYWN